MIRSFIGKLYFKYNLGNNRIERILKLAQVDFRKRYYNDRLGILWSLINPLSRIAVYYFVFTRIFQRNRENYALFIFAGFILWMGFTEASSKGSNLLKAKRYLIENIQFNWLDLHVAHMLSILMGLSVNIIAYLVIAVCMGVQFDSYFFLLPVILFNWFIVALAVCMVLSLIRPIFDDIIHIWNILTMMGFWMSGIFFDGSFYLSNYRFVAYLNPFVGIILNGRACLLENMTLYPKLLMYNLGYGLVLLAIATFLFNRYSHKTFEKI